MLYLKRFRKQRTTKSQKIILIFFAILTLLIVPFNKAWSAMVVDSYDNYDPTVCQTINATVIISLTDTYITVATINPQHPSKETGTEINITGLRIDGLTDARLTRSGETDIVGVISSKQATSASITFDLTAAANGNWDLKLTNNLGEITIKHNAIEITGG